MNPEVDLSSFRKGEGASAVVLPSQQPLVAPPRRIVTRYVLPILLILAFAGVSVYALRDSLTPAIPVNVVLPAVMAASAAGTASGEPEPVGGTPLFQAPGWIEPYPFSIDLTASTPGIVSRLHVLEGQQVSSGTVIAELIDDDARLQVRQAEAALNLKRAEYEAARANWEYPLTLKEAVRQARAEKERLEAEKARMQQTVELARREQQLSSRLASKGAAGAYPAQKAALEARAAEIGLVELDARIRSAAAALETAEERLKLRIEDRNRLSIAQAEYEAAEAALEETQYRLSQRKVVAQTSGTIMRLHVGEGATLSMDRPEGLKIASFYHPEQLQVRADVPLAEAAKAAVGLPAEIRVEALPDRVFKGEVVRVVHEADATKNTLPVKVRILDPDPALKPEMIARLQFSTPVRPAEKKKPAGGSQGDQPLERGAERVYIPVSLVKGDGEETSLWVAGADGKARKRAVKLGRGRKGDLREVVSGLEAPDKIIASNLEQLEEGSRVRIAATE